jgi:glycosyltransferase involved in cell wall biosynthesis
MVVCKQFYNEIVSYGVPRDKLTLIYNGVDTTLFTPIDKRESKAKFDLTEQDFTIGFSAKAASDRDGRKGVDILEAVLSELSHQVVNLHVVITGPGWSEVIERIRSEYLKIHYFPFLPDESMPDYFNAIDVYIVTARVEGGPVPPLEAMSCGTPVISTPVGTILDFVHDGVNGLIVPIGNSQAVIEQILKLYQDRPLAKRLGSEGRNLILAHLQWRDTLACIDQLYGTDIYREVSPEADKRFAKDLINLNERIFQKDVARWLKKQHIKKNWIEQLKQAVLRSRA